MGLSKRDIGKLLSELRKQAGLSQTDCAHALNVSDKAVSKWETGGSYPNLETLAKLSSLFGISLAELFAKLESPDKPYFCLAITGGPCAGKSAAVELLRELLAQRGWNVFTVREIATRLIEDGYIAQSPLSPYEFQQHIFTVQRSLEDALFERARECAKDRTTARANGIAAKDAPRFNRTIVLCDRGLADGGAYLSSSEYDLLLRVNATTQEEVFTRYDAVLVLESAAVGTDDYTVENNPARLENADEARTLDERVKQSWNAHPCVRFVPSQESFEGKLLLTVCEAFSLLGEPLPAELHPQRSFLVNKPSSQALATRASAVVEHETCMFLEPHHGVRNVAIKRERNGRLAYSIAEYGKRSSDALGIESSISADEYRVLCDFADPAYKTVERTNIRFAHEGVFYTMHLYDYYPYVAVIDSVEPRSGDEDRPIALPPFLKLVRELTGGEQFTLRSIARDLAQGRL